MHSELSLQISNVAYMICCIVAAFGINKPRLATLCTWILVGLGLVSMIVGFVLPFATHQENIAGSIPLFTSGTLICSVGTAISSLSRRSA